MQRSIVFLSIGLTRNIFPISMMMVTSSIDMLSRKVNFLQLFNSLVVSSLMNDVVIVKHALIALMPLKFGLRKLIIIVNSVKIIIILKLVIDVLHLAHSRLLYLRQFWLSWRLA